MFNCLYVICEFLCLYVVVVVKVDEFFRVIAKRVSDVVDGEVGMLFVLCGLNDVFELVVLY